MMEDYEGTERIGRILHIAFGDSHKKSEMKNYRLIAHLSYDMLGREIDTQICLEPDIRDVKFIKVDGQRLMYFSYALRGNDIPRVRGFDFIDIGDRLELADMLNKEIKEESSPREIRVIRPNLEKNIWGIFFKR